MVKRRHLNINYRDRKIWQQINFKKDLKENYKKRLNKAESYLLKIREEDVDRNEWLFKIEIIFYKKNDELLLELQLNFYRCQKNYLISAFIKNIKPKKIIFFRVMVS